MDSQILSNNPMTAVRVPRLILRTGRTSDLQEEETRALLATLEEDRLIDRHDHTLLALVCFPPSVAERCYTVS